MLQVSTVPWLEPYIAHACFATLQESWYTESVFVLLSALLKSLLCQFMFSLAFLTQLTDIIIGCVVPAWVNL